MSEILITIITTFRNKIILLDGTFKLNISPLQCCQPYTIYNKTYFHWILPKECCPLRLLTAMPWASTNADIGSPLILILGLNECWEISGICPNCCPLPTHLAALDDQGFSFTYTALICTLHCSHKTAQWTTSAQRISVHCALNTAQHSAQKGV